MKHFSKNAWLIIRRRRDSQAQAMVEFALVLPLLLLLLVGIIDLGRALFVYSQVSNATREAARYSANTDVVNASTRRLDCASIEARARNMFSIMPNTLNVTVEIERPSGTGFTYIACNDATNNGKVQNGDRVRVRTAATVDMLTLQFISPLVGGRLPGTWPIEFTSSRTLLPVGGIATGPTTTPIQFSNNAAQTRVAQTATQAAVETQVAAAATATAVVNNTATAAVATATAVAATQTAQAALGTLTTPTRTPTPPSVTPTNTPLPSPTATSTTPGAATNFVVASVKCNGQFDIDFTWNAPVGGGTVAWYRIFDSVSGVQIGSDIPAPATTYTVKGAITSNESRTFYIVAYSAAGVPGSSSNTAMTTCGPLPTDTPTPVISLTSTLTPTPGTPTPTATACPVVWATDYPSVKLGTRSDVIFMKAQIFCGTTPITNATVYAVSGGGTVYTTNPLAPLTTFGYYGTAPDTCNQMSLIYSTGLQMGLEATYTWNGVTYAVTAVPVIVDVRSANNCP
jgi:Flp pilus assembly protein TadG